MGELRYLSEQELFTTKAAKYTKKTNAGKGGGAVYRCADNLPLPFARHAAGGDFNKNAGRKGPAFQIVWL